MSISVVEKMKFKNTVERVLHVPGNFTQNILEMAIVMDCSIDKTEIISFTKEMIGILKAQSEVFRNVRLNTLLWKEKDLFEEKVTAMPFLQMGTFFDGYETIEHKKSWDELLRHLKVFYARSKLILVITKEDFNVENRKQAVENFQPFLYRKIISINEKSITTGVELMKSAMQET